MDILMVLFLRAKPWQLVLAVIVLGCASLIAFRMDHKAAFCLVGGFIHLWLYAICRFVAIQSGRFGGFRAFTFSTLVLLLAYWAQWAIQKPVLPLHVAVASALIIGSILAATGVAQLRRGNTRVAGNSTDRETGDGR